MGKKLNQKMVDMDMLKSAKVALEEISNKVYEKVPMDRVREIIIGHGFALLNDNGWNGVLRGYEWGSTCFDLNVKDDVRGGLKLWVDWNRRGFTEQYAVCVWIGY